MVVDPATAARSPQVAGPAWLLFPAARLADAEQAVLLRAYVDVAVGNRGRAEERTAEAERGFPYQIQVVGFQSVEFARFRDDVDQTAAEAGEATIGAWAFQRPSSFPAVETA